MNSSSGTVTVGFVLSICFLSFGCMGCAEQNYKLEKLKTSDRLVNAIVTERLPFLTVECADEMTLHRAGRLIVLFGHVRSDVSESQFNQLAINGGLKAIDKFKVKWIVHADQYLGWQYEDRINGSRVRDFIVRPTVAGFDTKIQVLADFRKPASLMLLVDSQTQEFLLGVTDFAAIED